MKLIETANVIGIRFECASPHMESGFPGKVSNYCTFTIERSEPNALKTAYDSYITDNSPCDASPIDVFSHTSFNLNGIPDQQDGEKNWVQPECMRSHWLRVYRPAMLPRRIAPPSRLTSFCRLRELVSPTARDA
ncbi:hypothetical_protein [Leishmania braziliensis MHOM/BR/75/M2904]|uniref:Hypothetical_protein n=1 Tax=Leishmania braziliensis MHOM/BR/75/M2904 TaxID=420245 RepID=A0A3P3ZH65_LEIBR|nr:unnamed protein product [Leishmania braziliensis]SYZ69384.1 hypothetical_protein [Leishmania braziliensis MHOM/BR/75/M2904]